MLDPFFWVDKLPDAPYDEERGWRYRIILLAVMHGAVATSILVRLLASR